MKYKTQNGWTKESMIAHIKAEFKGKSVSDKGPRCYYRGPNEKKCGVGIFISDNDFRIEMDRTVGPASELFYAYPQLLETMPLRTFPMGQLQIIHDNSHPDTTLQDMLTWVENNVE